MINVVDKERQADKAEHDASDKDYIYCAMCSSVIAATSDRTEVNGAFDHHCVNPHGFAFHVGCFSQALGCAISGEPQAADTWFPGFRWRLATCAECTAHLGWYFEQVNQDFFYGLILDRIQTEKRT